MPLLARAICAILLGAGAMPAGAATTTRWVEAVSVRFDDFAYAGNFFDWLALPSQTSGGPSPVIAVQIDFTVAYRVPATPAPVLQNARILTETIGPAPRMAQRVTAAVPFAFTLASDGGGDLVGSGGSFSGAPGTAATDWEFRLGGFFRDRKAVAATGALTADYASPTPFDAPAYAAGAVSSARTVLSETILVPLPATGLGVLGGLAGLVAVASRGRPARRAATEAVQRA